jgi:hypothetical protein
MRTVHKDKEGIRIEYTKYIETKKKCFREDEVNY